MTEGGIFFPVWATGLKPGLSLTGLTSQTVLIYWAITGCLVFDGFGVHFISGEKGPRFSLERARRMKNFVFFFAVSLLCVMSEVERNGVKRRFDSLTKWVLSGSGAPIGISRCTGGRGWKKQEQFQDLFLCLVRILALKGSDIYSNKLI